MVRSAPDGSDNDPSIKSDMDRICNSCNFYVRIQRMAINVPNWKMAKEMT